MQQGLVQVYTGDGKGKTTAAVGLAVRALGQGLRVVLVRFLKPSQPQSGEVLFLEGIAGIEIITAGVGVIHGQPEPQRVQESVQNAFERARELVLGGKVDLVIFDEAHGALQREALQMTQVLELIQQRPEHVELVFTGRRAPQKLLEVADLVTVLQAEKHPLQQGVAARRGIEY